MEAQLRPNVMPRMLLLLLGIIIRPTIATGAHAVKQDYTFTVQEDGKVAVHMSIEFHVAPGSTLSESYKSILDSNKVKSIDGSVVAIDSNGKPVDVELRAVDGWLQAVFQFPEPVSGDADDRYTISLKYTVMHGICSGDTVFRFHFPWAHRWMVPVTGSTYRVRFPSSANASSMKDVCLGGSGFYRLCGQNLEVHGTLVEHHVAGLAHGLFFEWPQHILPTVKSSSLPTCAACGAEDGCVDEAARQGEQGSAMLPQDEDVKTSTVSIVVVVLSIVLCCTIALFSIILRKKLRQWTPSSLDDSLDPEARSAELPKQDAGKSYSKFEDDEEPHKDGERGNPLSSHYASADIPAPANIQGNIQIHGNHGDHAWCPRPPPQSIGSTATAGVQLEIDGADYDTRNGPALPSVTSSRNPPFNTLSGSQNTSSSGSSFSAIQRNWEGAGGYYEAEVPESPRSTGSRGNVQEEDAFTFEGSPRSGGEAQDTRLGGIMDKSLRTSSMLRACGGERAVQGKANVREDQEDRLGPTEVEV